MCILTHRHNKQHTCSLRMIRVQKNKMQGSVQSSCAGFLRCFVQGLERLNVQFCVQFVQGLECKLYIPYRTENQRNVGLNVGFVYSLQSFFISPFIYVQCRIETHFFKTLHSGVFGSEAVQVLCRFSNQGLLFTLAQPKHSFMTSRHRVPFCYCTQKWQPRVITTHGCLTELIQR